VDRQQTKQERRRTRREEERHRREEQLRTAKRGRVLTIGVIIALVVISATSLYLWHSSSTNAQISNVPNATNTPSSTTPDNTSANNPAYSPVDNISCDTGEHNVYHVHAHLSLYINGNSVPLRATIGIASDQTCIYWLHTHDSTGVIHVEAPSKNAYTLGTFVHVWGTKFAQLQYPLQLNQTAGWQAYVNGKPYTGDWHTIPLTSHSVITLGYQSPHITPDKIYNWPKDLPQ